MTGREALRRAAAALRAAGIDDPEIEAEILLRHALKQDRVFLYVHLPEELSPEQEAAYMKVVRRRLERRPTAYLTGVREFYGMEFYVAPGVLIPRPETELLVDESLRLLRARIDGAHAPLFADIGTGSGAIVISVARHCPQARCFGLDRSVAALQIASLNAKRPRAAGRVELLPGDLLDPLPLRADVIAANLPYLPTSIWETLPPEIRQYEPREALDGGEDGLDVIRRFIAAVPSHLAKDGAALVEVGAGQAPAVLDLLSRALPTGQRYVLTDLAGVERVVAVDCGGTPLPPDTMVR